MTDVSVAREFKSTASEWTFDLQFASYRPRIDSQFETGDESLRPPYETAFGNDGNLLFTIAVERHLWSGFGTLSSVLQVDIGMQRASRFQRTMRRPLTLKTRRKCPSSHSFCRQPIGSINGLT